MRCDAVHAIPGCLSEVEFVTVYEVLIVSQEASSLGHNILRRRSQAIYAIAKRFGG